MQNKHTGGTEIWLAVKKGVAEKIYRLVPGEWFLFNQHYPLASGVICFLFVRTEGIRVCIDAELDGKSKQLRFATCYWLGDCLFGVFTNRQEAEESLKDLTTLDRKEEEWL